MSSLRERKLDHLFNILNANRDGYLEKHEFLAFADKLATELGNRSEQQLLRARIGQRTFWNLLQRQSDSNGDGKVSRAELLAWGRAVNAEIAADSEKAAFLRRWSDPQFFLMDASGDGTISATEYAAFCRAFGIAGDSADLFRRLDRYGDGIISRDDFFHLCVEFVSSDDPNAAGNILWGELS